MHQPVIDIILLVFAYLFTFLIPGTYIIETFFEKVPSRFKLPLYLLLSVMVSTYSVFATSMLLGYSRYSILVASSFFLPWYIFYFKKNIILLFRIIKDNLLQFSLGLLIFVVYLTALYPGIFTVFDGYVVMSSSNWQDTAMHSGIIESISQGNFPPQAPYFSGVPLNYYYFTDFHSAIIETLHGNFFPRVLVYDNPLFAMVFVMSVFALVYEITKSRIISLFSSFATVFYGSLIYTTFLKDVYESEVANKFVAAIQLLTNNSYAIEFGGFFQISPMADYFLQNRPMMIGLPAVVMVFVLSIYLYKEEKYDLMILPGLISAMLLKFQFFAFIVSVFVFGVAFLFHFDRKKIKLQIKSILMYLVLPTVFILFFSGATKINNQSMIKVIMENLKFSPWEEGKDAMWYLKFLVANLGMPFIVSVLVLPILVLFRKINKIDLLKIGPILVSAVFLSSVPLICKFTIMKYDMLKFYYFSEIFLSIICFYFIFKIFKNRYVSIFIGLIILLFTIPTSFTNLTNSYLNKSMAYTLSDLNAGFWIRTSTEQKSVFMDLANLHSPVTEVAGRLRVLSYINWPHSHGYNVGEDNVFTRLDDIRSVYADSGDYEISKRVFEKYNIDYVYFGSVEFNEFQNGMMSLSNNIYLRIVYEKDDIKIFKVVNI